MRDQSGSKRFPKNVYSFGVEPDPRFSLANERTFLAWLRTSLGFLAAGVALEALEFPENGLLRLVAALLFVLVGMVAAIRAWTGWARTERALRLNTALPSPRIGLTLALSIVVGVGLLVTGILL